jgi:hypothetical protein
MANSKHGFTELMAWLMPGVQAKTDEQIYQDARAEWIGVLLQLWDAIGKTADKKQLAVYVKQLGDIPLGILERVVQSVLTDHTYHTVPTIGEIWAIVKNEYGDRESLRFWTPARKEVA